MEGGREASVSGPVRKSGQPIVDGEVIQLMCCKDLPLDIQKPNPDTPWEERKDLGLAWGHPLNWTRSRWRSKGAQLD